MIGVLLPTWLPDWFVGIVICLLGSTFTALGLVIQKYSHVRSLASKAPAGYYKQFWWVLGFIVFLLAQLLNLAAMGLTPQVMLSCLGAWSLISNAVFASQILGENLNRIEKAMFVCTAFSISCVIGGTPSTIEPFVQNLTAINFALKAPLFLRTSFALWVLLVILVTVSIISERLRPIMWAVVSAILSGYSSMLFKCVALLIASRHDWRSWEPLFILAFAGGMGWGQVHSLNLGLHAGEALVVVPIYYSMGMLFQLLMGAVYFRELTAFTSLHQLICFWGGVAMLVVSIFAMTQSRISGEIHDVVESEPLSTLVRFKEKQSVEIPVESSKGKTTSTFGTFHESFAKA